MYTSFRVFLETFKDPTFGDKVYFDDKNYWNDARSPQVTTVYTENRSEYYGKVVAKWYSSGNKGWVKPMEQ